MSNMNRFFKENKAQKKNAKYAPTRSFLDEKGNPIDFEFRPVPSKENRALRDEYTKDVQIPGKPNMYRQKLDTSGYIHALIARSIVYPDLLNAELQDNYGVKTPEALLDELVNDAGEYDDLAAWVQRYQGYKSLEDLKTDAKN
nr:MAG TPA: tail assembly chaperone protein [Caudoviricetes sp.]